MHVPARGSGAALLFGAILLAPPATADICKYIDVEGRIIYSNVDLPDTRRIDCTVISSDGNRKSSPNSPGAPAASRSRAPTPAGFPRVDGATQKNRDDLRRRVLNEELASEEKSLAEARSIYNNGTPIPLAEERGNPVKLAERVSRLRQTVQLHERNVEALRKEIGNIR